MKNGLIVAGAFVVGAGVMAGILLWNHGGAEKNERDHRGTEKSEGNHGGAENEEKKSHRDTEKEEKEREEEKKSGAERTHEKEESAKRFVDEARRELAKGEVKEAESLLDRAEAADEGLDLVPLVRGQVAMARSDFAAALRHFETALGRKESTEARAGRADALFQLGRYAGAVDDATKAGALFTRAAAHAALGNDEQALRDYVAWTEGHPDDAQAWVNRGNHEMRMNMRERAIGSWERAIAADPAMTARLARLIEKARE